MGVGRLSRGSTLIAVGAAFVVGATGTAVGTALITGDDVKDGSLTGADVRNGSLTGSDVRDGSLTGTDLRNGSVGGTDVRDGSLTGTDVRDGSLRAADLTPGAREALRGQAGAKGDPGPSLVRQAINTNPAFPLSAGLRTVVASIGEPFQTFPGITSGPLVHPPDVGALAIGVFGHVTGVSSVNTVDCSVEASSGNGTFTTVASVQLPPGQAEGQLFGSISSAVPGTSFAFRLSCAPIGENSGSGHGDLMIIAGPVA